MLTQQQNQFGVTSPPVIMTDASKKVGCGNDGPGGRRPMVP